MTPCPPSPVVVPQGLKRQKSALFEAIKTRESSISELNQVGPSNTLLPACPKASGPPALP